MPAGFKVLIGFLLLSSNTLFAQAKVKISGAVVNMNNASYLSTKDVIVANGGLLNVKESTLDVKDSITSADNINLRYGNLEMSGGNSQVIPSGSFKNNAVNHFYGNNNSATGVSLGGALDVYNSLTYTGTAKIIYQ